MDYREEEETVGGLRRRRRRAGNSAGESDQDCSLMEEDGVLYWRDGVPGNAALRASQARRARLSQQLLTASLVLAKAISVVETEQSYLPAIGTIDKRLNPSIRAYTSLTIEAAAPEIGQWQICARRDRDCRVVLLAGRCYSCMGTFSNAEPICSQSLKRRPYGKAFSMRLTTARRSTTVWSSLSMRPVGKPGDQCARTRACICGLNGANRYHRS